MAFISNMAVADSQNSSNVPLISGGIFTGTATNASGFLAVFINCFTDQDGEILAEWSSDGTNWDNSQTFSIIASTFFEQRIELAAAYFRLTFTNTSAFNQTILRLQTILQPARASSTPVLQQDVFYPQEPAAFGTGQFTTDPDNNLKIRGSVTSDAGSYRSDFSAALGAEWVQTVGSGSIGVASSKLNLGSGTANGNITRVVKESDYAAMNLRFMASVSQRIANQTGFAGFIYRVAGVIQSGAYIKFSGTDNTKIICSTQSSAADVETKTVTLPTGFTSANNIYYIVILGVNKVSFLCKTTTQKDYFLLAQMELHIPNAYQVLDIEFSWLNSAVVTNSTLAIDFVSVNNIEIVEVRNDSQNEPLPVLVTSTHASYQQDLAQGKIEGEIPLTLVGVNTNIGAGATADIWSGGGTFVKLAAAAAHTIVSTSALDTNAAGTGARKVRITGLNANYVEITEVVNMAGTTPVALASQYIFVSKIEVIDAGSGGANAGTITVTSGTAQAVIPIGENISNSSIYIVPAGYTLLLQNFVASFFNTNNNAGAQFRLYAQELGGLLKPIDFAPLDTGSSNVLYKTCEPPIKFAEKTFLKWRVSATTNNTLVSVTQGMVLIQNP